MMQPQSLPWQDPLCVAQSIDQPYWVLLYSGAQQADLGRFSLLACDLEEHVEASHFDALEKKLSNDVAPMENAWFGYFGYGLRHDLEKLPPDMPNALSFADLCMMRFATIYHFDHDNQQLTLYSKHPSRPLSLAPARRPAPSPPILQLGSNMSGEEYKQKVARIIDRIRNGELYQANLTRKFIGQFAHAPHAFSIFRRLGEISPAPYSAYMAIGNRHIISSSPERFLHINRLGHIDTRPIKGTAPRYVDVKQDQRARDWLAGSEKNHAENLMIVDLMRHDLSKVCVPGSVKVEKLHELTSHATVHHLSSTVCGRKLPQKTTLDAIKACFPPGSMTGAPKIRAMQLCGELERQPRGVYSGALGWLGGDGSCDLSVVIRTLLVEGDRFEFQVGGGIVADSIPDAEWEECLQKAQGIAKTLQIEPARLRQV